MVLNNVCRPILLMLGFSRMYVRMCICFYDAGEMTMEILFNLSRAFNTVNHCFLLQKLCFFVLGPLLIIMYEKVCAGFSSANAFMKLFNEKTILL